jgi:hypothetical protein
MLLRPKLASLSAALVTSAALLLSGCTSSKPRDINYGTDVGLGFVPPDVAPKTTTYDAATEAGIAVDSTSAVDGGVLDAVLDAALDAVLDAVSIDAAINGDS